ncbi:Regulatory protein BlaR1 [compost metagenome]
MKTVNDLDSLAFINEMDARNQIVNGIAIIWIIGCIIGAVRMLYHARISKMLFKSGILCEDEETIRAFNSCKQQLHIKRKIKLKVSGTLYPVLIGWLKPTILLPYDHLHIYSTEELRYILLHELQHFKHKDVSKQIISHWVEVIFWFQPFLIWAMRRLRKDIELYCDARVLKRLNKEESINYGLLLIKQGQHNSAVDHVSHTGVYLKPNQSQLTERIEEISKQIQTKPTKRKIIQSTVMIVIMTLMLLPINPTYANIDSFFGSVPTCYIFWIDEGIDPKGFSSIETMSAQIAGLPSDHEKINLLIKQKVEHSWLVNQLSELWPVAIIRAHNKVEISTEETKRQLELQHITKGQIVVMIQHHYTTTKLSNFSGGQIVVVNISELELKEHIEVY